MLSINVQICLSRSESYRNMVPLSGTQWRRAGDGSAAVMGFVGYRAVFHRQKCHRIGEIRLLGEYPRLGVAIQIDPGFDGPFCHSIDQRGGHIDIAVGTGKVCTGCGTGTMSDRWCIDRRSGDIHCDLLICDAALTI